MSDDAKIAGLGRQLAEALSDFAYSRKDEDKKRVAYLQFQLCAAVKAEGQQ
jgi:hypothetical protein